MHLNRGEYKMCFHHIYSQVTKVIGYPQHQLCPSTVLLTKMYISLDVFLTLLQLYFQSFVLVLYLWTVYLYCIFGQCICIVFVFSVFVLYLWAVVPINWPAHLSSLPTQASIFARSLNLNLQFQRLILSNRKIICKISNRQII